MSLRTRLLATGALAMLLLIAHAPPAAAKIVKTRRAMQVRPGIGFTLGSGLEFQSDTDSREYGFPFLFEWTLSPAAEFVVEPGFITIRGSDGSSIQGWDDTESSLRWELVRERRTRPAISVQGGVLWPTSRHRAIAEGVTSTSLGLLVTKDIIRGEFSFNVIGTRVGLPATGRVLDTAQLSAAVEWHLTPDLDLAGELLTTRGFGRLRGHSGPTAPGGGGLNVAGAGSGSTEGTLGLAHYFSKRLKFEEGLVVQTDGTWQVVAAWEWDFGEGR